MGQFYIENTLKSMLFSSWVLVMMFYNLKLNAKSRAFFYLVTTSSTKKLFYFWEKKVRVYYMVRPLAASLSLISWWKMYAMDTS